MTAGDPELARFRDEFPVTERYAYFNAAANAPLPRSVAAAIAGYLADLGAHGSLHYRSWFAATARARALAARLFGCGTDEVALLRNTSEGMNVVAHGLPFRSGDSVVIVERDFPANVYPWLRLRERGVDVRRVRPDSWNRATPDAIAAACDATTRLVAVSWVQFSNGYRLDLAALSERLRPRGILLFVDAIQGLGCLEFDVERSGADFASADAHKFLLAPEGIGVFYVRRSVLPRLRPAFVSWLSMKDPFDVERYAGELRDGAQRFEFATPNTAGIFALAAALEILFDAGIARIERHVLALGDQLCEELARRGYSVRSPRANGEASAIVAFERAGRDPGEVQAALERAGVQTAVRAGTVRAALHLYNDAGDVVRLAEALP